jgi:hypothetical protein
MMTSSSAGFPPEPRPLDRDAMPLHQPNGAVMPKSGFIGGERRGGRILEHAAMLFEIPRVAFHNCRGGPRRICDPHGLRLDRLAGDVSPGDGAANDALTADFIDPNETGFQVLVKASPGTQFERANLIDGEVPMLESSFNSDELLCL